MIEKTERAQNDIDRLYQLNLKLRRKNAEVQKQIASLRSVISNIASEMDYRMMGVEGIAPSEDQARLLPIKEARACEQEEEKGCTIE